MTNLLETIWQQQKEYNEQLGRLCTERSSPGRWAEILVLGLINEIDELLRELGWKRHRGNLSRVGTVNRQNLAFELADLTKYVLSLWQVYDYSLDDMLLEVARKNSVMRARLKQEFSDLPKSERVLLVDIDGTLADLRYGLWELALLKGLVDEALVEPQTLNPDVDFGIDYRKFQALKQEFTENHGYFHLRPLRAACDAVRRLAKSGTKVIAYTARPADKYPSLWLETLSWLDDQDLPVAGLYIGSDVRIKLMLDLIDRGCDVVLFDDDPETIGRALNSGIKCVVPKYPYNAAYWRRNHVYAVDARHGQIVFPFSERDGNVPDEKEIKAIPE